jgi:hypothetical protein
VRNNLLIEKLGKSTPKYNMFFLKKYITHINDFLLYRLWWARDKKRGEILYLARHNANAS